VISMSLSASDLEPNRLEDSTLTSTDLAEDQLWRRVSLWIRILGRGLARPLSARAEDPWPM